MNPNDKVDDQKVKADGKSQLDACGPGCPDGTHPSVYGVGQKPNENEHGKD